jgi:hypothetical protein
LIPASRFALLAALFAGPAFCQQPPEIPFESVPNWLKLPEGFNFGEAAGVALNSKGHVFVYNRGAHTGLYEFDQSGRFLREIGKDLYGFVFAHVVRIDKDDNIWCVDEGSNMVMEFNPEGRVIMTIGRRAEPSEAPPPPGFSHAARASRFIQPADGHPVGQRGQRLHHRRLRQLARRQGR